jgi:hypothetical protein
MRYRYVEPGDNDQPVIVEISDEQIVREYGAYWVRAMLRHGGRAPLITRANCVDDFCIVHWAAPIARGDR